MKKILSFIFVFCLVFSFFSISASGEDASANPFEFRTFTWGDSKDTILEKEGTPFDSYTNQDGYRQPIEFVEYFLEVEGLNTYVNYTFCNEGLFEIRCVLQENHDDDNLFIDDYINVKDALIKAFGEPRSDREYFKDSSYEKDYADKKAEALSLGYYTYHTSWLFDDTMIEMRMDGNFRIITSIVFTRYPVAKELGWDQ